MFRSSCTSQGEMQDLCSREKWQRRRIRLAMPTLQQAGRMAAPKDGMHLDCQARPTCCSGILSLRTDFRSVAVLRPRDTFSKHVPKDVPESALRLLKSDNPLILLTTPESTYACHRFSTIGRCNTRSTLLWRLLASGDRNRCAH